MKFLKIFLKTYETALFWAILPMPAFVVPFDIMIREQINTPAFIFCLITPLFGLIHFCDILSKKETLYQLPMSQRMKFFVPQAMVLMLFNYYMLNDHSNRRSSTDISTRI